MIIKVLRNADDWAMVDGIDDIQVNRICPNKEKELSVADDRTIEVVISSFDDSKPTAGFTQIVYKKGNSWKSIMFNTVAFVCSDSGKTVEVIHG